MIDNKVAIVTAAGRGMGAACVHELVARGYKVALMSTSANAMRLAAEIGGLGMRGSVTKPKDLKQLVGRTFETYGRIDAVINNTGHPPKGDLLKLSDNDWFDGFELVLLNVIRMMRLVTPIMQVQGQGAIVNILTFSTFEPSLDFPISSTLRAGLASYTKLYADRYGQDNIRINNVLPGYIETYTIDTKTLESIPLKRQGSVTEIAKTAAFLLSEDAAYITGQNIRVDGGITRSV